MTSTSPLRYPGGKTRFTKFILSVLDLQENPVELFAEPFCGGAGVSIALLEAKKVQRIAINDIDPLVSSFWKIVFGRGRKSRDDLEWLIRQVESVNISLEEWRRQKNIQPTNLRDAAWKCLFLNRTSFNGIIYKAGPIGGWRQINRTVDVRFNREKIIEKIFKLNDLRMQVDRTDSVDWRKFCARYNGLNNSYIYLDPPYYHRAEQLYGHLFDEKMHRKMRNFLRQMESPWLLSYDDAPEVRSLYGNLDGIDGRVMDQTYSTHPIGGASFVGRELIFSNRILPEQPVTNEQRPHVGLTVVGSLDAVYPTVDGPVRRPIAERLLITETL